MGSVTNNCCDSGARKNDTSFDSSNQPSPRIYSNFSTNNGSSYGIAKSPSMASMNKSLDLDPS